MSQTSEVDQMGQETSRAARRAGEAVASIVARVKASNPKAKRLGWRERKEARKAVSRILREERRLEKREREELHQELTDLVHAHHAAVWTGHQVRADEPMETWFARQQDLTRSRIGIERHILTSRGLNDTERGQAVTALRQAHYLPAYQLPSRIITPTQGVRALQARVQTGLSRLRNGMARPALRPQLQHWNTAQLRRAGGSEMRRQRYLAAQLDAGVRAAEQSRPTAPPAAKTPVLKAVEDVPTPDVQRQRADAAQDLRHAELARLGHLGATNVQAAQPLLRGAVHYAKAAGLQGDQIAWEIANAEANSRSHMVISYRTAEAPDQVLQIHGFHASEQESIEWAESKLQAISWEDGTKFSIVARELGHPEPYHAVVKGDLATVTAGMRAWRQELAQTETTAPRQQPSAREQQLAAELEQVRADRDRFRTERDEAVAKLVTMTPPAQRFGSRARRTAQPRHSENAPVEQNGHQVNGATTQAATALLEEPALDPIETDDLVEPEADEPELELTEDE
ncbi:hypothetical protein [Nocardia nova]|uniref:hypothetical protein n=1 Tax=Nocardia nova TaxID=37330 RepID=UPI0018954D00|nr:hypothetical protein [Nocardia nova]MBF6278073.1 hypothetical protein [Nocardia nova]